MTEEYKNKKGYLKIRVLVDVKTKKILLIKVTDKHVHDVRRYQNWLKIL